MKRLAPSFVLISALGCSQPGEPPAGSAVPSAIGSSASASPTGSAAPVASVVRKHGLPTWDEVESGHKGTNPPFPVLVVDAVGYCYKKFEGGMTPSGPNRLEAICDSTHPCGKQIECPKGASAISRGKKAELAEAEAAALASAHLEKAGKKPSGALKAQLIEPSKLWILTWAGQPEVRVDAISGSIIK